MRTQTIAMALLLSVGCSYLPDSVKNGTPYKGPPDGTKLCSELARRSNSNSTAMLATGVVLSIVATGLLVIGGTVGPNTDENANWAQRGQGTILASAAGILGVPAAVLLARSGSTAGTSRDTILQMKTADNPANEAAQDRAAYNRCIEALAASVGGKADLGQTAKGAVSQIGGDKAETASTGKNKSDKTTSSPASDEPAPAAK